MNRHLNSQFTDSISVTLHNDSNIPADKVSFIVDVYNFLKIDNNLKFKEIQDGEIGRKFSFSEKAHQVLASVISLGIEFQITHLNEKYLVAVNYWSKETDFDCNYFVIDPLSNSINSNHWLDEDKNLVDAIKQLKV